MNESHIVAAVLEENVKVLRDASQRHTGFSLVQRPVHTLILYF